MDGEFDEGAAGAGGERGSRTPGRRTLVEAEERRWGAAGGAGALQASGLDAPVAGAIERARAGGGEGLPGELRARFERSLGTGLGDVRVHRGGDAAAAAAGLSARAFAMGRDVFMADGEYAPGTPAGDALLAHEVAHTVQQRGGERPQAKLAISAPGDAAEHEADRAAAAMLAGMPARVSAAPIAIARTPPGSAAASEAHAGAVAPTMTVGSSDVANAPTAQERVAHDQGGGPDIARGLGALRRHTGAQVLDAVRGGLDRHNASDPEWHGAGAQASASAGASLASLCQEIWYLGSQMYMVDRTGHILPGDFHHDINVASLAPGGVYFWGEIHVTGHQTTSMHRLFRIDGGVRAVAGDIAPRTALGEIALIERARSAMQLHHGIGVIVSPQVATTRRQHGWDGARLWRALRRVPGRIPWAVRSGVANLLEHPGEALIGQLQNQASSRALHWLGRAAGPVGVVMLMHTGWELGETLAIASGAHSTDDEIDIAAQAVARQLVSIVAGELVDRGLARAGRALRGRGPAPAAPHPAEPPTSPPPAEQHASAQANAPREPHANTPTSPSPTEPHASAAANAPREPHASTPASPSPTEPHASTHANAPREPHANTPASPSPTEPHASTPTGGQSAEPHGASRRSQPVPPANGAEQRAATGGRATPRETTAPAGEAQVHADGQSSAQGRPPSERERLQAATRREREARSAAAAAEHDRAQTRADTRRAAMGNERDQMLAEDIHYAARNPEIEAELRRLGLNTAEINAGVRAVGQRQPPPHGRATAQDRERVAELLEELHENRTEIQRNHERRATLTQEELRLDELPEIRELYQRLRGSSPGDAAPVNAIRAAREDALGLPAVAGDAMAADHLVPLVEIVHMRGFASIRSRDAQLRIVNGVVEGTPRNLQPLRGSLNSARGDRSWRTWRGWEAAAQGNPALLESMRARVRALADAEDAMRAVIATMIERELATQSAN